MNPQATRLIVATTVMLGLVAVVVLHNSFAPRQDPCADPSRVDSLSFLDEADGLQVFIDRERDQPLWVDGTIRSGSLARDPYLFRYIRSYDLARFLQSGLLLLRNSPLPRDRSELRTVDIDGQAVPVQLRFRETGNSPFVTGYIIAIGNEPVASPALGALRHVLTGPLRGPKPITILLIESRKAPDDAEDQEAFILEWLTAGWREYRAICDPLS